MGKLRCVGGYRNEPRQLSFEAGQVFDADPEIEAFLMADAPGCFEAAPEKKALRTPPDDKMVRSAETK